MSTRHPADSSLWDRAGDDDTLVATIGVSDLVIVKAGNAVLVMPKHAAQIRERDPAHVLGAGSELASEAQAKGHEHFRERSSFGAQHDSNSRVHDASSTCPERPSHRFPLLADFRKESLAGPAVFIKDRVATVSVVPNGRCGDKDSRGIFELRQGVRQQGRSLHAAGENSRFACGIPSSGRDTLTGKVDDGVYSLERVGVEDAVLRIPANVRGSAGRTGETKDLVPVALQQRFQVLSDQTGRPRNKNGHWLGRRT